MPLKIPEHLRDKLGQDTIDKRPDLAGKMAFSIDHYWQRYLKSVLGEDLSPTAITLFRTTFFCGARAADAIYTALSEAPDEISKRLFVDLKNELDQFRYELEARVADTDKEKPQ